MAVESEEPGVAVMSELDRALKEYYVGGRKMCQPTAYTPGMSSEFQDGNSFGLPPLFS